jgi:hypothetical protein
MPVNLPDISGWIYIPSDFKQEIFEPSPLGTLIFSALFVAVLGAAITVLWPRPNLSRRVSLFERFVDRVDKLDRGFIYYATYAFGTHYRSPWIRKIFIVAIFTAIAVAGAMVRWPACIGVISVGLIGVFVIFRHWSRIEDDKMFFVTPKKKIPIDGDIIFEVTSACLFILIFAPVAFAQMQLADVGFKLDEKAGPFAFEGYALIEILKIGFLVQYYDIYADIFNFRRLGPVGEPSFWAKFAVIAFRLSVDLIILGVLKRVFDIARRVSAGLDLNPLLDKLSDEDSQTRIKAAKKLGEFAVAGKPRAKDYLEEILKNRKYHRYTEVCFAAAKSLCDVAKHSDKAEGIHLLRDIVIGEGYDKLGRPDAQDEKYSTYREDKGDALLAWAKHENAKYPTRVKNAILNYNVARTQYHQRGDARAVERVQRKQEEAQRLLKATNEQNSENLEPETTPA